MKWLTRGWAEGEFSDEEHEKILRAYWQHVEQIASRLDPAITQLARKTDLHDAVIEDVRAHWQEQRLVLSVIAGDQQAGYRLITLEYLGVQMGEHYRDILKRRSLDRQSAILYDEVDVEQDGSYVHRLMFSPEGELSIWFKQLNVSTEPRADRRTFLGGSYVEHD